MKVLIVESHKDIRAVILLNLNKIGEIPVIGITSFDEALSIKEQLSDVKICISRAANFAGVTREKILELTNDNWEFMVLNEDILRIVEGKLYFQVQKFEIELKKIFLTVDFQIVSEQRKYISIPIDFFYHINELNHNAEIY